MLFNSIQFAFFLPIVFAIYWVLSKKSIIWQNGFLLAASYVFYGFWDYRFLFLIFASSFVDYFVAAQIDKSTSRQRRKQLLAVSLIFNLGLLGVFKYYNFFVSEFQSLFHSFGIDLNPQTLSLILPVGISFYTFQTLSYSIDVYRGKMKADRNILNVFLYVAFFPQLVAGPIEKASSLLPQMQEKRQFSYSFAVDGLRQILWGLFKKIVIADSCAVFVNQIYANPDQFGSYSVILATLFFSFQIYGDFSGYSDIAIGTAKLFGFRLRDNFLYPYFSRDIAEFWRRWHISLSSWFREYVYYPLGGSKKGLYKSIRNVLIVFLVSGFWHGANWTFIIWGAANAVLFIPLMIFGVNRKNFEIVKNTNIYRSVLQLFQIAFTFILVNLLWVIFRSTDMSMAGKIYTQILKFHSVSNRPDFLISPLFISFFVAVMLVFEWVQRDKKFGLDFSCMKNTRVSKFLRWGIYIIIFTTIILSFPNEASSFIYFQF